MLAPVEMTISPENEVIYQWQFLDSTESCEFTFPIPSYINQGMIKVEIESDSIVVSIPGLLPFLCGQLSFSVLRHSTVIGDASFKLLLFKSQNTPVELPIISIHPKLKEIDPNSAFAFALSHPGEPLSNQLFERIIAFGYVPALLYFADLLKKTGNIEQRMYLLVTAAQKYQNQTAIYLLALEYIQHQESCEQGFLLLTQLSMQGSIMASIYVGLVLSPLSDFPFAKKNGKQSFDILSECLKQKDDEPLLYKELSKLLNEGIGCEKNEQLSRDYYDKAVSLSSEVSIEPKTQPTSWKTISGAALGVLALAVGVGFFIFRRRR